MSNVFKEIISKADHIALLIEKKDDQGIQTSSAAVKELLFENLADIKKAIVSLVKSKSRRKAQSMRNEVKDGRVAIEGSIRSVYLTSTASQSDARSSLILVAKKMIKIERALSFAEDMLFAGEITKGLEDVIHHAESVGAESKDAVVTARNAARLKQAEQRDHGIAYRN